MLAPMAGITETAYRIFMRKWGAPCVITELISSEGFVHGSKRTKTMLDLKDEELPCGVQVFGHEPKHVAEISHYAQEQGASFIDINYGCPVPKVTKCGAGSGALKDLPSMERLLSIVRKSITIPLSIKIRTGWDENSIVAQDIVHLAKNCGVDWITIHGRTREQGYRGDNNWKLIEACTQLNLVPIVGNGDLKDAKQVEAVFKSKTCHGVMLGRAALANPLIFNDITKDSARNPSCLDLIHDFLEILLKFAHPKVQVVRLKKMAGWLSIGHENSAPFRSKLMREAHEAQTVLEQCLDFFDATDRPQTPQQLTFLKGGHG
jgi:nifR3 family TIM-barrel protein